MRTGRKEIKVYLIANGLFLLSSYIFLGSDILDLATIKGIFILPALIITLYYLIQSIEMKEITRYSAVSSLFLLSSYIFLENGMLNIEAIRRVFILPILIITVSSFITTILKEKKSSNNMR
ncbi:hypothetical protein AXF12_01800 [Capnocytophaga haemolytica]|uniref:Uncharacterized protein n=1 Tax=Capnocytophaga haemolytica TaxID=45243 RepID=A0ABM5XB46_9FLAO|nr:hypothetical protein [Capnocytophaga haemolytica]AMD84377.1 hypothetical protein AXF12_01800 [Capnocytophaga haemolytica]